MWASVMLYMHIDAYAYVHFCLCRSLAKVRFKDRMELVGTCARACPKGWLERTMQLEEKQNCNILLAAPASRLSFFHEIKVSIIID